MSQICRVDTFYKGYGGGDQHYSIVNQSINLFISDQQLTLNISNIPSGKDVAVCFLMWDHWWDWVFWNIPFSSDENSVGGFRWRLVT